MRRAKPTCKVVRKTRAVEKIGTWRAPNLHERARREKQERFRTFDLVTRSFICPSSSSFVLFIFGLVIFVLLICASVISTIQLSCCITTTLYCHQLQSFVYSSSSLIRHHHHAEQHFCRRKRLTTAVFRLCHSLKFLSRTMQKKSQIDLS